MKKLILLALLIFPMWLWAQDFDIYKRIPDDKVKIPAVYSSTELNEFQLLSRDARMMDMAYAMIVPGYVHFKAKEPKAGYCLLTGRLIGFAGVAYSYYKLDEQGETIFGILENKPAEPELKTYQYIGVASAALVFFTYFYDWIHGKVVLEKKQEIIRYKYGFKLQMEGTGGVSLHKRVYPSFGVSYSF